ncbi:MAG: pyruvate kinase [Ignavibacteriaceae bacterium]|nr:pyruvate kinase [Ignavibacteriaceae bacterium]HRI47093.1 pyruvate kinase [Ignavibacteriaceae bacterium]
MSIDFSKVFAKTKILCTLGPATSSKAMIKQLMESGLDGVRLNFSHGDYNFYQNLFKEIHDACIEEDEPLAILLDLQGPKIRIGDLSQASFEIFTGDTLEISIEDFKGDNKRVSTSYKLLVQDAKIGEQILVDDGLIRLRVKDKTPTSVICDIENGGTLKPKKGMNLPGMELSTPSVTEKDFRDLEFALQFRIDFIALSFVRKAIDISQLKEWLKQRGKHIPVIAKIEKKEAIDNFESILKVADGIMVARGDLGVELEPQDVPIVQKHIIKRCNEVGKLVITATQMFESMISNPIPTRAEASDVANAVWDGTDVVMLSGETSVGKYPLRTVEIMNNVVLKAELNVKQCVPIKFEIPSILEENLFDSMNRAIVAMSEQVNAAAIVVFTHEGRTAQRISKFRPKARIIAISDHFETMNKLCLKWGVTSLFLEGIKKEGIAIENAKKLILDKKHVKAGDIVIFTAGAPYSEKSRVNWLRFESM